MAEFYLATRVRGAIRDTLLARWGTYVEASIDHAAPLSGPYFEFDVARRIVMEPKIGCWELVIAYRIERLPILGGPEEGCVQCLERSDAASFVELVSALPVVRTLSSQAQTEGVIAFRCVG